MGGIVAGAGIATYLLRGASTGGSDIVVLIISKYKNVSWGRVYLMFDACVIAASYARIFFRNAINNGLLLIENADLARDVQEGDEITVHVGESIEYREKNYPISPLPQNLLDILEAGGLVRAMQRLNGKG